MTKKITQQKKRLRPTIIMSGRPGYSTYIVTRLDGSLRLDKWYQNKKKKTWHRSLKEVDREINGKPSEDTCYFGNPPPKRAMKACTMWV